MAQHVRGYVIVFKPGDGCDAGDDLVRTSGAEAGSFLVGLPVVIAQKPTDMALCAPVGQLGYVLNRWWVTAWGYSVATSFLSDSQLEHFRGFPDICGDELVRFFTLTPADVAFVAARRGRGPSERLGLAVQLCTLPWLGFVPDEVSAAPPVAVARLGARLGVDPGVLASYGEREQTRTDHLRLVSEYLGWKPAPSGGFELKDLEEFILSRAMEHDSPSLLFGLAREYLLSAKTVRPGVLTMMRLVATARSTAGALTYEKVSHLLNDQVTSDLDRLLTFDDAVGLTRLAWLTSSAVEATASSVKSELEKLMFLRAMDAHVLDLSMLAAERRRFLATLGRRSTNQALARREPSRRYPILLTVVSQSAVDLLDEVITLFDQAVSARESRAKTRTDAALAERAKKGEARQLLLEAVLSVLADHAIPDEDVGALLRGRIGMQKLHDASAAAWPELPRDHGRLAALNLSYSYLRQFAPNVLAAIDFQGGPGTVELMEAVAVLKELNRVGGRKVPATAPTQFVPSRFRGYLTDAENRGDDVSYRHYWELCVLLGLRDGLRSGDVHVPGSRRYADPSTYLFTPEQWLPRRSEFCAMVGKPAQATAALSQGKEELHAALADLDRVLAATGPDETGAVRLDADGDLVIPPLSAEDIPSEANAMKEELAGMLPFVPIASLLIELDHRTGFLRCFTHASGHKTPEGA